MINKEAEIHTLVKLTVKGPGTNLAQPSDLVILRDGEVAIDVTPTFIGSGVDGVYNITFLPNLTGVYSVHAWDSIHATVSVVTRSVLSILRNLEDEALGSWSWDKKTGDLVMLRQDGTTLATFAATDTLTASSRERT